MRTVSTGALFAVSIGLLAMGANTAILARGQAQAVNPSGRWVFSYEVTPARGRGNAPPAKQTVILQLELGPGKSVTGTLDLGTGRAPGNNPLRPVEISDGRIDGGQLTFSAWEFDGYKNRVRYAGAVTRDALNLTMTRETSTGPEKTAVRAVREPEP